MIDHRTYASRRRVTKADAASVFVITICLVTLIPARLTVPTLTALGRPALILAMGMFIWWILVRLNPRLAMTGPQPMRWVVLAYLVDMLVSYAVGALRGLTTMEANSADRWMLQAVALSGLILLGADGIRTWERLHLVLRAFVWCAGYMAVIGIAQAVLFFDLTEYMLVPGLVEFVERTELTIRGGGIRVASTTGHYIEFSVVMALAFPFAMHYALHGEARRMRQVYTLLTLLIAAAIPATVSRTGFVALAIVVLILVPLWGWRTRYNIAIMGAGLSAVLIAAKPSLASTLITMFETVGSDESITSRTDRYDMVYEYFVERPWFGRGSGTWVSPQYQYLDNQWLSMVLTNGVVGVAALLAVHITAIVLATVAMRRAQTMAEKHIAAGLVSTQLVAIVVGATFDSLSFTTCAIMVMLLTGLCGAVWRLTHPATVVRTAAVRGG